MRRRRRPDVFKGPASRLPGRTRALAIEASGMNLMRLAVLAAEGARGEAGRRRTFGVPGLPGDPGAIRR